MSDPNQTPSQTPSQNVYQNAVIEATINPVMPTPDAVDAAFAESANRVLQNAVEVMRVLIPSHQSAIAVVVQEDWHSIRKFFSLSPKYAQWADYKTPATGYGIHGWMLKHNEVVRLTQTELENHPEWKGFGTEAGKHPPMRGWLSAPIKGRDGTNWGLLQLSDKVDGDFTESDEEMFVKFSQLVSDALEALWDVRNFRKDV